MLIVPRSKVSVPVVVVMTTRSRAPPSAGDTPAAAKQTASVLVKLHIPVQVLLPSKVKIAVPETMLLAASPAVRINPVVLFVALGTDPFGMYAATDVYPDALVEPLPICIKYCAVTLSDTPLNIMVTRFAQLGIELNVILVPLVDATAVPEVITLDAIALTAAPVIVGLVSVLFVNV